MSESNEKATEQQATKNQEPAEDVEEQVTKYDEYEADQLRELLRARDEELQYLEQALNEAKEARLRKVAELDNYQKRVKQKRSQVYETAKARAIEDFLDINDDIKRTLEAAEDIDVNKTFLDGVLLVANKFEDVLEKHGVERIDQEGVPFDVDLHDAMMRQKPEDDSIGSDVVLNVVENGYRMNDRTIRHAKVIVSE